MIEEDWEPGDDPPDDYVAPSSTALAALLRGLRSAIEEPLVSLGDFSFNDDESPID